MKGFIKRLLREGSYDKPVKYGKDIVDRIREINPSIDKELNDSIFSKYDKVYCKGGAARLALLIFCDIDNNGGLHGSDVIRDSDFVYIGDYNKDVDGTDIEFSKSYEEYFSDRDITLNEVLLSPTELIFTRRAYRDAKKEVINPVSNYYGSDKMIDGRLLARMFLFASRYGYKPVATLKYEYDENDSYINFETLVCLLKAYELGIEDKYFRMFKEYCGNFNFNDFGSWLVSLITSVDFDFYGREDLLINDLSKINDSEIEGYLNNSFYQKYPELKKKVNRLQLDDNDFNEYLTKPNRGEQNPKMRRSVNMSLAESIKRLLREGLDSNILKIANEKIDSLPVFQHSRNLKSIFGTFTMSGRAPREFIDGFEEAKAQGKLMTRGYKANTYIDVMDIHLTQLFVNEDIIKSMFDKLDKLPPINVVQFTNGEIVAFDGHHRIVANWALGKKKIKVNIIGTLNEGELKRSNFKKEWEYQEAYYNQKNSKLKKFAIKNLDELVKVEGAGTYELFRGSKDGNQNIGAGIYAYGIHYTNDIKTANEFGDPTNFKVKLKNPKIVDATNVKSDGLHAEERTNVLKSEGYDSLVVRHKKIYTVYGTDMIYELPYVEYEVIKF